MKLTIKNLKCESVNTIYNLHHFTRNNKKRAIQELVFYEALKQRKKFKKVRLVFTAYFKGKRLHDPDNLYVKPMIDGLVAAGIIVDDNNTVVESVTLKVVTGEKTDFVEIEIL